MERRKRGRYERRFKISERRTTSEVTKSKTRDYRSVSQIAKEEKEKQKRDRCTIVLGETSNVEINTET